MRFAIYARWVNTLRFCSGSVSAHDRTTVYATLSAQFSGVSVGYYSVDHAVLVVGTSLASLTTPTQLVWFAFAFVTLSRYPLSVVRNSKLSNTFVIPKRSFRREVDAVASMHMNGTEKMKWSESAIDLIQSAAESEITRVFTQSQKCANHAGRSGVTIADMSIAQSLVDERTRR